MALNLRWPTAREISGPWLRCLAAGTPTVTIDLVHTADVPALDPRTWQAGGPEPCTVAIDILDEAHSLRLAMKRLATDEQLRASLADAGRRYWAAHHSIEGMVEDYRALIDEVREPGRSTRRPAGASSFRRQRDAADTRRRSGRDAADSAGSLR